ncbi:hypothetical protein QGN29_12815 [Temperatibacter marinus]|uniref:Uncharacterized protein n=1 Tax=Temperatibacter marinus TaxID=1456591 RepID=A0AA52EH48_9PROT|nr:hypothetical protein [Temperatibacter marinus]WND02427.1 hypothetical protein QGN29_12815 [Temperatibacter marinus]
MGQSKPTGFFQKFFASQPSDSEGTVIEIGDRFVHHESIERIWVVEKVQDKTVHEYPLVTMHQEGHPDLLKVLSSTALNTGSDYMRCQS